MPDTNLKPGTNEKFTVEEVSHPHPSLRLLSSLLTPASSFPQTHLVGADLLAALMTKSRWIAPSEADVPRQPVRFLRTTLDPSSCVLDAALMDDLASLQSSQTTSKSRLVFGKTSVDEVVKVMLQKKGGLPIADTPWGHKIWVSLKKIAPGLIPMSTC